MSTKPQITDYQKKIGVFVEKATDTHVEPPKEKHVRSLIVASHEGGQNAECVIAFYMFFYKRLSTNDPVVCLKSLVLYHRLLQDGCPLYLSKKIINSNFFARYLSAWNASASSAWGKQHGQLCTVYAESLTEKLRFHLSNPGFTGDMSADKYDKATPFKSLEPEKSFSLLHNLFGLLKALMNVADCIIEIGKQHLANSLVCSPCIPLIIETYNVYECLERILRALSDIDDQDPQFKSAVGAFNRVFTLLQRFYWECAQIQYVATTVSVPQLPDDPPSFVKYRPASEPAPQPTTPPEPEPAPPKIEIPPQQSWIDMMCTGQQSPVRIMTQSPTDSNPFADMLPSVSSMAVQLPEVEPEPVVTPVTPQPDPRDDEIDRLKKRIAELELLVVQLRAENNKLKEQLRSALSRVESAQQAMSSMEAQVSQQKQADQLAKSMEEQKAYYEAQLSEQARMQEALAKQLADLTQAWQQDCLLKTSEVSKDAETEIDSALSQLNNPAFVGNSEATTDTVRSDLDSLRQVIESFLALLLAPPQQGGVESAKHANDVQRGIHEVSKSISTLLADSKGVSCNLPKKHADLQSGLIGSASRVGVAGRQVVSAGAKSQVSGEETSELRVGTDTSTKQLSDVLDMINRALVEDQRAGSDVSVSIDDDAQRQLLAAAAQIESLAAQLRESRKNIQHDPSLAPGAISVDEAIMEAAIAISSATHMLVNAAAAAQKERVEKGRAQATAARPYVANAVWAEGLVSAGRAVAMATRDLTNVANDAAKTKGMGEMIEEGLIAASHGVAASTAQLVAATRSKSDAASPTQTQVEEAAKAVTRATELLVEAAKAVGIAKQQQQPREDYSKLGANAFRIKEMEQQMLIQRLEKELNAARNKLGEMHRQAYKK